MLCAGVGFSRPGNRWSLRRSPKEGLSAHLHFHAFTIYTRPLFLEVF